MKNTFSINTCVATEIADHYKTGVQRELNNTQDTLCRELLERSLELDGGKLQSVLEACFFASLETEEGRAHDFAIAITPPIAAMSDSVVGRLPPDAFAQTYSFANHISIDKLPKIAPAIAIGGQRIGVWFEGDNAKIWGFLGTGTRVSGALQIRTFQPGQLGVFVPLCPTKRMYLISATRAEPISGSLSLAELLFNEEDLNKRRSSDQLTKLRYCGRIPRWTLLLMDIANRMRQ